VIPLLYIRHQRSSVVRSCNQIKTVWPNQLDRITSWKLLAWTVKPGF